MKKLAILIAIGALITVFVGACSRAPGNREITETQVNSNDKKWAISQVTNLSGGMPLHRVWSPDSRKIIFDWFPYTADYPELLILDLASRKVSVLADKGCQARYAPKNTNLIAYVAEGRIWLQTLPSGTRKRLTDSNEGYSLSEENPSWSPDGKWIAFNRIMRTKTKDEAWLCIYSIDNGTIRVLGPTDSFPLQSPEWSPNSESLCYIRHVSQKGVQLWKASINDGGTAPLLDRQDLFQSCPARWSPLEGKIAYVCRTNTGEYEIHMINPNTKSDETLALVQDPRVQDLAWSPNGKRLAFVAGDDFLGYEIRALDLTSNRVFPITNSLSDQLGVPSGLSWAPDSSRLAFEYNGNLWLAKPQNK